jgi:hypothetical protein
VEHESSTSLGQIIVVVLFFGFIFIGIPLGGYVLIKKMRQADREQRPFSPFLVKLGKLLDSKVGNILFVLILFYPAFEQIYFYVQGIPKITTFSVFWSGCLFLTGLMYLSRLKSR